jgi:hypothetical protein
MTDSNDQTTYEEQAVVTSFNALFQTGGIAENYKKKKKLNYTDSASLDSLHKSSQISEL